MIINKLKDGISVIIPIKLKVKAMHEENKRAMGFSKQKPITFLKLR